MSDDPLRVPEYLGHILVAIQRINRYTAGMSEAAFLGADLVQDAVIRNIEIIGEASRNVARHLDLEIISCSASAPPGARKRSRRGAGEARRVRRGDAEVQGEALMRWA